MSMTSGAAEAGDLHGSHRPRPGGPTLTRGRWAGMPRPGEEAAHLRTTWPMARWPLLRRLLARSGTPRTRTTPKPRPTCSPPRQHVAATIAAQSGRRDRLFYRVRRSAGREMLGRQPPPAEGRITATASGSVVAQRRIQLEEVGRVGARTRRSPAHGAMRWLTPAQRRQWQEKTL